MRPVRRGGKAQRVARVAAVGLVKHISAALFKLERYRTGAKVVEAVKVLLLLLPASQFQAT